MRRGNRPLGEALVWSIFLSVLFLIVYGGCNAINASRAHAGHFYLPWELRIPFVPVMVIPYMSIDLFFFFSTFLCDDRFELRVHGKRLILAIAVAGACFLLFPLRAAFVRPEVPGALGVIFRFFWGLDHPYNLAPSLHVALCWLLWRIYSRPTRGVVRAVLGVWFALILVSPVLTHQHHLIDVALGGFLGALCLAIFPDQPRHLLQTTPRTRRIAAGYAAGAVVLTVVAVRLQPGGIVLLWPIFMLGTLAAAYAGLGETIFQKRDGLLSWHSRVFFGPYLLAARISLLLYTRVTRPWDQVVPGLLIGQRLSRAQGQRLTSEMKRIAVLDATAEFSEAPPLRQMNYLNIPILDLTPPQCDQLHDAVRFIRGAIGDGGVFVHCAIGRSRSVCVVAAYLLAEGHAATPEDALNRVRTVRPVAVIREDMLAALQNFAHSLAGLAAGDTVACSARVEASPVSASRTHFVRSHGEP
jgi:membrane-associated phospholipid phosphatase